MANNDQEFAYQNFLENQEKSSKIQGKMNEKIIIIITILLKSWMGGKEEDISTESLWSYLWKMSGFWQKQRGKSNLPFSRL